jgi:adenosylmethionine-8-amino-7-oxononanoate aminotransferase
MDAVPGSALLKQRVLSTYPVVTHGAGVYLYDDSGNRYLDGCSGAMTASIGHGVAEIAEIMRRQAQSIAFSYRTQFTNEPAERLARRLTSLAPGDLDYAFFVSSGSEAAEFAIRTAVGHWRTLGQPDKVKVLSRQTSYHGMTMGALSLSGHSARRPDYGSLLHPFPVTPPVHAQRYARPGESVAQYSARAVGEFERALLEEDPETVAAVIVEPIVGAAGGVLVPPQGYLASLRTMCDRLGILLIADEVITGIGRTGDWFMCGAESVVPDILLFGKGISGGYAPVAGALLRRRLVEAMAAGDGIAPFGHTFSGNPLGAATSLAVLNLMEREDVLENVRRRGRQLETGLRALGRRDPRIAHVRGRGLLWGFDLTQDTETLSVPPADRTAAVVFADICFRHGLLVYPAGLPPFNNAVIVCPPLTITREETDDLLARLGASIRVMGERLDSWSRDDD